VCDTDHLEPNDGLTRRGFLGMAGAATASATALGLGGGLAGDPVLAATGGLATAAADPDASGYEAPTGLAKDSPAKETALSWIDRRDQDLIGLNDRIWEYAEPSLQEWNSALAEAEFLRRNGFTIEWGAGGLPSTFVATFSNGTGKPVIGFSGEYDALPQLSQNPDSTEHDPLVYDHDPYAPNYGYGHGCGHSALGAAAAGAAVAVAKAMTRHRVDGTLKFFGSTAEEQLVGKAYAVKRGVYDGLDAFVDWHPSSSNAAGWGSSNALESIAFTFMGTNGHGGSPLGNKSALNAARATALLSDLIREQHMDASARLHFTIPDAGRVPNVNPSMCGIWFFVREGSPERVRILADKIRDCARGAALATQTTMTHRTTAAVWNVLPLQLGAELMHDNMVTVGPPAFSEADQRYGRALQKSVGVEPTGFDDEVSPLAPPETVFTGGGSTDVADISWNVPTLRMGTAGIPSDTKNHSWLRTGATASNAGHVAMVQAARYLAAVTVDLLTQPDMVAGLKEEFAARTKKVKWRSLLPGDYQPPVFEPPAWFLQRTQQSWPPPGVTWPPPRQVAQEKYSPIGADLPPANIPPKE
jgi:amidohydrolase